MKERATPGVKQYRVTLTDHPERSHLELMLSWRTFPCRGDEWHGRLYATADRPIVGPVGSDADLATVLRRLTDAPWRGGLR
jgi:hypothetical protein